MHVIEKISGSGFQVVDRSSAAKSVDISSSPNQTDLAAYTATGSAVGTRSALSAALFIADDNQPFNELPKCAVNRVVCVATAGRP
jgi:hypothetical protein